MVLPESLYNTAEIKKTNKQTYDVKYPTLFKYFKKIRNLITLLISIKKKKNQIIQKINYSDEEIEGFYVKIFSMNSK